MCDSRLVPLVGSVTTNANRSPPGENCKSTTFLKFNEASAVSTSPSSLGGTLWPQAAVVLPAPTSKVTAANQKSLAPIETLLFCHNLLRSPILYTGHPVHQVRFVDLRVFFSDCSKWTRKWHPDLLRCNLDSHDGE